MCDTEGEAVKDAVFASGRIILLSETNNLIILKQVNTQECETLYK